MAFTDTIRWPSKGTAISASEIEILHRHAALKGVGLKGTSGTDIDVPLICEAIDDAALMLEKYPELRVIGGKPFGLYIDKNMKPNDFAEVSKRSPQLIHLNEKAYRDRDALAAEYALCVADGWFVAGTDYHHIIYHEFGHVLGDYYRINVISITQIIFGLDSKTIITKLRKELSKYSVDIEGEIISEMISASMKSDPEEFVLNFIDECDKIITKKGLVQ
jgi:hypothetical protein